MMKQDTKQTIQAMSMKKVLLIGAAALLAFAFFATVAQAASTIVVTPTDQQGWSTADTRPGGSVTFVLDADAPLGDGALNLTTNASTTAKAQYLHAATTSLSDVTTLSYYSKHVSGPAIAAPSYQLLVDLNGTSTGGFTTFVYEPYQNGVVTPGVWQQWDVDAGQMWSSRSFSEGTCTVVAGAGGAPFYTLAGLQTICPDAIAIGFGVNIGSNNPSYNVNTDAVVFNDTTYDFEVTAPEPPVTGPANKDACKKGGWMTFTNPTFKNQGQCVSSTNK